MGRTRTREPQIILASITLFTFLWLILLLHPKSFFLFTSLTDSSQINEHLDDVPLANILLNARIESTNPFLPPLINSEDGYVRVLTHKNFSDFVGKNKHVMVAFYPPNDFWSRKIVPEFAAAAAELNGEDVEFAAVDSTAEIELVANYSSLSFLTVYMFVGGCISETYDYSMETTRDAIVSWSKLQIHGRVHHLMNQEEAKSILADNSTSTLVLAVLDSLEGQDRNELLAASRLQTKFTIYMTDNLEVAKVFNINSNIKRPNLVILEKETKKYTRFGGRFTRWAIYDFLSVNTDPLVVKFTDENAQFISDSTKDQIWLLIEEGESERVLNSFRIAAEAFRGQLLFVHVQMNENFDPERELPHGFGTIAVKSCPAVVAFPPIDGAREILTHDFNSTVIKAYAEAFLKARRFQAS